jgi:Ca2+-transporting ATPase
MKGHLPDNPHASPLSGIAAELGSDLTRGLAVKQIEARWTDFGYNELPKAKPVSSLAVFFKQFHSGLTYILLLAAVISVFIGDLKDTIAIVVVILINVVFSFVQERRADAAVAKLKEMVVPEAAVIRDGEITRIAAREIVPGDIIVIQEGDRIPADARLISSKDLRTDESALTGESAPVNKKSDTLLAMVGLSDQKNMVWMGTAAVAGTGKAMVVATGGQTAFGQVAVSLTDIESERAPFESAIDRLGWRLGLFSIMIVGLIAVIGLVNGENTADLFIFAVAMAVAVIPEGLPSVLTVVLAIGVWRMAKRQAVVRHVPSVETLGETDVICTDKTGTLTRNQMTVRDVVLLGLDLKITGEGYQPTGDFLMAGRPVIPSDIPDLAWLLKSAALASSASIIKQDEQYAVLGDPTEGALTVAGAKAGFAREQLSHDWRLLDEMPFSSDRKMRAMLYEGTDYSGRKSKMLFAVGAYEVLEAAANQVLSEGIKPYDRLARDRFQSANEKLAAKARRVIAVAMKEMPSSATEIKESDISDLIFVGLTGLLDPPRPEVSEAIRRCQAAGIRVIMITGDQQVTALAVAKEIGLVQPDDGMDRVFNEAQVAQMSDSEFESCLDRATIFARVTPDTKLRLVTALKNRGHIVAMTGDGVNDAPALKKADVGISMGLGGTDVAREVSDMVLMDDNFATVVNAIEEGRVVYRNVKQTFAYLFTTNMAEAVTVLAALSFGLPSPLLAGQILWMNLVTDGFPVVALATEPTGHNVLDGPPRRHSTNFITRNILLLAGVSALVMTAFTVYMFSWEASLGADLERMRTVAFTTMCFFQLWNVFNLRSQTESIFTIGLTTNRYVLAAVGVSALLQLAVLYTPFLNRTFKVVPLSAQELIIIVGLTALIIPVAEGYKWLLRREIIPKAWL